MLHWLGTFLAARLLPVDQSQLIGCASPDCIPVYLNK